MKQEYNLGVFLKSRYIEDKRLLNSSYILKQVKNRIVYNIWKIKREKQKRREGGEDERKEILNIRIKEKERREKGK